LKITLGSVLPAASGVVDAGVHIGTSGWTIWSVHVIAGALFRVPKALVVAILASGLAICASLVAIDLVDALACCLIPLFVDTNNAFGSRNGSVGAY
jgi:hypothetical protein